MKAVNGLNPDSVSLIMHETEIEEVYVNWKRAVMTNDTQFLETYILMILPQQAL